MPRRSRRPRPPARPLDPARARGAGPFRRRAADGREYFASAVAPARKAYVCAGCGGPIAPGQPQLALWEADSLLGVQAALELRRHWHAACAPL
ncbi:MAG: hypothetical protein LBD51_06085 [Bifidobacteriaceae bacterium]|jgi:hypothetical protein|nr:hypothetical protein [Bifidobacteriaceae bacterium]